MALVVDRRAQLGNVPGLHALVIGVGDYPHLPGTAATPEIFDMGALTCTVPSAVAIARWLEARQPGELPVPLATLRVLLSPPDPAYPAAQRATLAPVQIEADAWRASVANDRDGFAFFYFAGHGVSRGVDDAVMLLEDFNEPGRPLLATGGIDARTLFYGMAPCASRPEIARSQVFLIDACRVTPPSFRKFERLSCPPAFNIELPDLDDRRAPIFFSALQQGYAQGLGGGPTVFGKEFLASLEGDAAEEIPDNFGNAVWSVSNFSLSKSLHDKFEAFNRQNGGLQDFVPGGIGKELTLRRFGAPPQVPVIIQLEPTAASVCGNLDVETPERVGVLSRPAPVSPHPVQATLPAGVYFLRCRIAPPSPPYHDYFGGYRARPGGSLWHVRVE